MKRSLAALASTLAIVLATDAAYAQDNPPAIAPSSDDAAPAEIVVTALRREQSLLSVPLSIQAATGEQLNKLGIDDLTSLRFTTPGFTTATDSGFTQIFIRGVGNNIYVGADPSVSQFVDDVPRIYGSTADNLVDVERVEVLKGAQGGLYGRNSTGGVVNIITRNPSTDELRANFIGDYGEKNTFRAAGHLNVPISDRIAFSIAAERDSHDAYVRNQARANPYTAAIFPNGAFLPIPNGTAAIPIPGVGNVYAYSPQQTANFFNVGINPSALNDQDFWAVSGKLLLKAADNFTLTLAADRYDKNDNNGAGWVSTTPNFAEAALAGLFNSLGVTTNLPPGFIQSPTGKFVGSLGVNGLIRTKEWGASATAEWSIPGVDLTSITAYRSQNTSFLTDAAVTTVQFIPLDTEFHDKHFFYQELRAISSFDGPFHLLGGATYLNNQTNGGILTYFLSPMIPAGDTQARDKIENWSIYGQIGYDFTAALSLSVSGRFQRETNRVVFTSPVLSTARDVEQRFVPSATLSYKLSGGGNAYVRWARGFKTGGIDTVTAPIYFPRPSDGSIFKPETVDTYEAGLRNSFFDRRLQVTAAVFYNDYKDLQVFAHPAPGAKDALGNDALSTITTAVINVKSARTYGVEGSVAWRVADPLRVGVNVGWLNAKYRDFKLSGSSLLAPFDRDGEQMPLAPKFQFAFNADLDQPVGDRLRLVGSLLVSHNSSTLFQYASTPGLPDLGVAGYWLTNARIGIRTKDDKYGIALVADNLFNKVYYVQGSSGGFGNNLAYGSPRIVKGEISIRY